MIKILLVLSFLLIFLFGCQAPQLKEEAQDKQLQAGEGIPVEYVSLSDIQIDACNSAHESGTCDTRLVELEIVLKGDCCEVLGKCC